MIIEVGKYLFFGAKHEIDRFFQKAQQLGLIEFISEDKQRFALPRYLEDMQQAIQVLKQQPQFDEHFPEDTNSTEVVQHILQAKKNIDYFYEQKKLIESEILKITPFGDFCLEEISQIHEDSGYHIFFYAANYQKISPVDYPDLIFITTAHDLDYFISITSQPVEAKGLYQLQITKSLSTLKTEKQLLEKKIHQEKAKLKNYAKYLDFLKKRLIEELDHLHLVKAKDTAKENLNGLIFTASAWIPKKHQQEVEKLVEQLNIDFYPIAIEKIDKIPTCMENTGPGSIGEDLVDIYDVPSTDDKDPSTWVFFSFAIFFAMIIADAGYGIIYLLASLFLSWKFPQAKGMLKRFIKLARVLACSCIVWGLLTTSFFGIELKPNNPLSQFSLLGYLTKQKTAYHMTKKDDVFKYWVKEYPKLSQVSTPTQFLMDGAKIKEGHLEYEIEKDFNDNILMELSLLVGIIHISLSLIRNLRKSLAGIGWILFILGGYLYFPKVLEATSMVNFLGILDKKAAHEYGIQLLGVGFALAYLTSLIQNRLSGITEPFKVIELFADILSYLRLYALGLASMILAGTFNSIGADAGFFFGLLIILIGHVTNIVLGTMAGVIHGLRLNFLEWYHHSFEGGGKKFNPLKLLSVRSN